MYIGDGSHAYKPQGLANTLDFSVFGARRLSARKSVNGRIRYLKPQPNQGGSARGRLVYSVGIYSFLKSVHFHEVPS